MRTGTTYLPEQPTLQDKALLSRSSALWRAILKNTTQHKHYGPAKCVVPKGNKCSM